MIIRINGQFTWIEDGNALTCPYHYHNWRVLEDYEEMMPGDVAFSDRSWERAGNIVDVFHPSHFGLEVDIESHYLGKPVSLITKHYWVFRNEFEIRGPAMNAIYSEPLPLP